MILKIRILNHFFYNVISQRLATALHFINNELKSIQFLFCMDINLKYPMNIHTRSSSNKNNLQLNINISIYIKNIFYFYPYPLKSLQ